MLSAVIFTQIENDASIDGLQRDKCSSKGVLVQYSNVLCVVVWHVYYVEIIY